MHSQSRAHIIWKLHTTTVTAKNAKIIYIMLLLPPCSVWRVFSSLECCVSHSTQAAPSTLLFCKETDGKLKTACWMCKHTVDLRYLLSHSARTWLGWMACHNHITIACRAENRTQISQPQLWTLNHWTISDSLYMLLINEHLQIATVFSTFRYPRAKMNQQPRCQ